MSRRGAGPTVEDAAQAAGWHVFEGQYDGRSLTARFNSAFKGARDLAAYPIQIGVAIPLNDPDERGMPRGPELEELRSIEEQIIVTARGRAVLVGAITTNNMREFVLYTGASAWIQGFDEELQTAINGHKVQVMARNDPTWDVYGQFVR